MGMDYSLQQRIIDGLGMILDTTPGSPDQGSYVTENQLADWIKGKILFTGYYHNGNFYSDSGHTTLLAKVNGALYIDQTNANKALYVCLSSTYQSLTEEAQVQAIRTELANGTLVPLKATQDSLGNQIDTTYAKKSDLLDGTIVVKEAEIATKDEDGNNIKATYETKADASDLKSAIQGNAQRIENLEVAVSGSLVQTNTDATMANTKTITNTNEILPWAILKRVGARAVAWNSLINPNATVSSSSGSIIQNNLDGTFSITGTSSSTAYLVLSITPIVGHKYYFAYKLSTAKTIGTSGVLCGFNSGSYYNYDTPSGIVFTETIGGNFAIRVAGGYDATGLVITPILCDLTAMNEVSLTADQFRALYPASYYSYDTGHIYDLNPSAFKVVGRNKIDPNGWEANHAISTTSGNVFFINGYSCTDFIKVSPSTTYYNKANAGDGGKCYYDANKNFLWGGQAGVAFNWNTSFTLADNVHYVRFYKESTSITDFCLNISDANDGTFTEYKETTIDTSFTSDYKYVNEDCHDYSENVLVDGEKKRKEHRIVGSYTFTGNEAWSEGGTNTTGIVRMAFTALQGIIKGVDNDAIANITNDAGYSAVTNNQTYTKVNGISVASNGNIYIYDENYNTSGSSTSFASYMAGKTIYFELATPNTPTLHNDPIPNFPCEDGTTITAITPQTDLVNAIDVPTTIAYMTKIGG